MAIQPPGAQPAPAPAPAAQVPPAKKSGCAGCGIGCFGCLGVIALVIILLLGGGYFFLVAQAQAGVAAPASLLVASTPVDVGHNDSGYQPATSGEALDAGSSVRTGHTGHATVQFPDGSLMRLSPDTTVTIQSAQLSNAGTLKSATLQQKIGRTFSEVQHLAGGASFQVGGHSVSAEVRGTQFEVLVRPNNSNQIKVFDGTVQVSGQTNATLHAGQQVDADPNGKLGPVLPGAPDRADPFALQAQCERAVAQGTSPGTTQVTAEDPISTGQSAEVDYRSPGGTVTAALCYPGSSMTLSVFDPTGVEHASRQTGSPVVSHIDGDPGLWKAVVHAVSVAPAEAYVVAFATNATCAPGNIDTGTIIRQTLSNQQLQQSLAESGVTGVSIAVEGTSPTSARVHYSSNLNGFDFSWTIDFYAATPNLGYVFTEVTVHGVNITTQIVSRLNAAGAAVTSVPQDYIVDRVYSCSGAGGMMVIEGHR